MANAHSQVSKSGQDDERWDLLQEMSQIYVAKSAILSHVTEYTCTLVYLNILQGRGPPPLYLAASDPDPRSIKLSGPLGSKGRSVLQILYSITEILSTTVSHHC